MLPCLWISEPLSESKVNYVNIVLLLTDTNQKIVRFNIPVQEMAGVYELDSLQHLVSEHQNGLEGEFALAVVQKILEGGPKEVDDHHIVVAFDSEPMYVRDTDATLKDTVELGLIEELRMLGPDWLQLDGYLFVSADVGAMVDISKSSTPQFS